MEEQQMMMGAAMVGGALLMLAMQKVFGGSENKSGDANKAQNKNEVDKEVNKSKESIKGKKAPKEEKKAAAPPAVEKKAVAPPAVEKKAPPPPAVEKKAPPAVEKKAPAPAAPAPSPKKAAAPAAPVPSPKKAAAPAAPAAPAAAPSAASKKGKSATADSVKENESAAAIVSATASAARDAGVAVASQAEEEWATVPGKKRKKPLAAPTGNSEVAATVVDGKASVTLEIGDFGPTLIGPSGSRIASIQATSGAKVDVDKATKRCTISGTGSQVAAAKELVLEVIGSQRKVEVELGAKRTLVFGSGGEGLKKIQSQTGARLDLERGSSLLTISGKDSCVEEANNIVQAILSASNVDSVFIGEKDRPTIIGKGGENIKRLQLESGATLDLDTQSSMCTISGDAEQVAKAKELIKLYIEHRGPPPEATETLKLPVDHGRLIIGKAGATVQSLQTESKTRINISLGGTEATITVSGDKVAVEKGVQLIHKLIADNSHQSTVALGANNLVKAVIGEKGASINNIRDTSGARLEIAQDSSHVVITGTKAQVAKAKAMVEKKIADELGPPPVPQGQKQHSVDLGGATGKIIGASGSNMERLQKEYSVSITVKNGTMCYVTGPAAGVESVKKEISDVLERHEEQLERARKQQEELAKVTAQQNSTANSGGWDVPGLDGTWGNFSNAPASADPWGAVDNGSAW